MGDSLVLLQLLIIWISCHRHCY